MQPDQSAQTTYVSFYSVTTAVVVGLLVFGWVSLDRPSTAAEVESGSVSSYNLQTMALHQPSRGVIDAVGGPSIDVVGEAAVVAPEGPQSAGDDHSHNLHAHQKQASIYVVREGDTLSEVAEMFGVSVETIVWANNIEGGSISPEDVLIILPTSGVRHEAEEGDTISSIAERYDASAEDIREYNQLENDDDLAVGAIIDVPGGEIPEEAPAEKPSQANVQVAAGSSVQTTQNTSVASGYYAHPVPGSVVTQRAHGYNAVDFGASTGSSVLASASGRVTKSINAGWNGGYGKFIVVEHDNGTETLYSHLNNVIVSRGQRVVKGQVIGYLGSTGRSTGPHLHFEIRGAHNPFADCGLRTSCGS